MSRCPLVGQAFVHGDSLQTYLVAVVVPDADELPKWAASAGTSAAEIRPGSAGFEKLAADVLKQMTAAAKAAKLNGFEIPKKVHLDLEPWTPENGMLTPTFKLKRNDVRKKYQPTLDALYAAGLDAGRSKL